MNAIAKGADEKFCSECGSVIKAKAEICPKCGVRQLPPPVVAQGRNRIVAALLAFFIGGFGIHRFYLGRTVSGVLYLLFFWTFIPAILAFIETIRLLVMSDLTFAQKYP
jgi:uncharacterized OB-fold protein